MQSELKHKTIDGCSVVKVQLTKRQSSNGQEGMYIFNI